MFRPVGKRVLFRFLILPSAKLDRIRLVAIVKLERTSLGNAPAASFESTVTRRKKETSARIVPQEVHK